MEPIRIVMFPSGEELPAEEAHSARYVFAAVGDADTIFAFDSESAEEQTRRWAEERGLGDDLARALEVAEGLPEDPSIGVDEAAESARAERLNARLREFSTEVGIPVEAPEFIERAHDAGVFDSAVVHQQLYYGSPWTGLNTSCPDLRLHRLPLGALSARTEGYRAVCFYDQPNYGPVTARRTPTFTAFGKVSIPTFPRRILSVLLT